jgi:hypothetical protein
MNIRKSLSAFAVAGVLAASMTAVASARDAYSDLPLPYGDLKAQADAAFIASQSGASSDNESMMGQDIAEGPVLDGQVAAVDESGNLVVRTDDGLIAFQLQPQDVQGMSVGDPIEIALLEDESE